MRVAVADVAAAAGDPVDPLRVIDPRRLAELHIDASLADAVPLMQGKSVSPLAFSGGRSS